MWLALGWLPLAPVAPRQVTRVAVIVSQEGPAYRDALAGLRQPLERRSGVEVLVTELNGRADRAEAAFKAVRESAPTLIVTLGSLATRESVRRLPGVPLVAGMILTAEEISGSGNATGVFLQFPVAVEMEWMSRMLPNDRRIGILYHSEDNHQRVAEARRLAPGLNLVLQAIRIDAPGRIPDALDNLSRKNDVLWGMVDPMVFNPETAQTLLLFSLKSQLPLVGPSPPWVRAGALFALDRDYADVGLQCAELAEKVLDGAAAGSLGPVPPRRVRLSLNKNTADQLKIELPAKMVRDAGEVFP